MNLGKRQPKWGGRAIKIVRPWQAYRAGDIIEPNAVLRRWLLDNRFAEPAPFGAVIGSAAPSAASATECAATEPDERAMREHQPVKRKRGRPRKVRT